jgi:hypothetical protein
MLAAGNGTPASSPTPSASTPTAPTTSTSASAAASITAWERRWPASRCKRPSRHSPDGCTNRGCSPTHRPTVRTPSSAARNTSRSSSPGSPTEPPTASSGCSSTPPRPEPWTPAPACSTTTSPQIRSSSTNPARSSQGSGARSDGLAPLTEIVRGQAGRCPSKRAHALAAALGGAVVVGGLAVRSGHSRGWSPQTSLLQYVLSRAPVVSTPAGSPAAWCQGSAADTGRVAAARGRRARRCRRSSRARSWRAA